MKAISYPYVGPWAREKLDTLQRYLDYYTTALKNQPWRTIYVDAFAGGGHAVVRAPATNQVGPLIDEGQVDAEQREFIKGSPRVALDIPNPFTRYVFIEPDGEHAAELDALRSEYAGLRQIDVRNEGAAEGIEWLLSRNIKRQTHRGVVFLDPFGAQLGWKTIQLLADSRVFEVVINFALNMAIQRMLPNSGMFQAGWRERLDAYFGSPDWYAEVYQTQTGLLGSHTEKRTDYLARLLAFYRERLRTAFEHVSHPKLIRNTKGSPLYYLLWAGPHPLGLKGANHVLGMGQRTRRR